jgi:hypothetical protein
MRKLTSAIPLYLCAFVLMLSTTLAFAQKRVPAGGIVWNSVARVYFNPNNGTGQVAGYFTYFPGVDGLFAGTPSEATARFTFRSDTLQLQPVPSQGGLSVILANSGEWRIYFNPTPSGNWSDLDSFSRGQVAAVLTHGTKELISTGVSGTSMFSGDVLSSSDFVLNAQEVNLGKIFPHGFTVFSTISNVPVSGTAEFPVGLPYAGSAIAKGQERNETSTASGSNDR